MSRDNVTDELSHLYHDTRHILKKVDRLSYRTDCPEDVKYNVLRPIKSKLLWFKSAIASRIGDVNAKAYRENYNEAVTLNRIQRVFSRMTPNEQEFAANVIGWIADGKVLKVEIAEEEIF
jgi:hypothetical protein